MQKVGKFEKVSKDRFITDMKEYLYTLEEVERAYSLVSIPKRATKFSAGYDLVTPIDIKLRPGERIRIPTGIKVKMREDCCLLIAPRSGLGSRYRFQLDNTVGIIDSDYYYSENEGHIFVPMINDSRSGKELELKAGSAFAQCVFLSYGITDDDNADADRLGGFGSTG